MSELGNLAIGLSLDFTGFEEELIKLDAFRPADFKIKVAIELDTTKFDRQFKAFQDKYRANSLQFGLSLNTSGADRQFKEFRRLNQNFELDFSANLGAVRNQVADLRRELSAIDVPVVVRYANTAPQQQAAQKVNPDVSEFEKNISKSIEQAFSNGLKSAGKISGGGIGSALTSVLTAPLRGLTAFGGSLAQGLMLGLTQEISRNFGSGISAGIEKELAPIIGSSKLLGREIAGALTGELISSLGSDGLLISRVIEDLIGKQKILIESGARQSQQQRQDRRQTVEATQFYAQERAKPGNVEQIRAERERINERATQAAGLRAALDEKIQAKAESLGAGKIQEEIKATRQRADRPQRELEKLQQQLAKQQAATSSAIQSLQQAQASQPQNTAEITRLTEVAAKEQSALRSLQAKATAKATQLEGIANKVSNLKKSLDGINQTAERVFQAELDRVKELEEKIASEYVKFEQRAQVLGSAGALGTVVAPAQLGAEINRQRGGIQALKDKLPRLQASNQADQAEIKPLAQERDRLLKAPEAERDTASIEKLNKLIADLQKRQLQRKSLYGEIQAQIEREEGLLESLLAQAESPEGLRQRESGLSEALEKLKTSEQALNRDLQAAIVQGDDARATQIITRTRANAKAQKQVQDELTEVRRGLRLTGQAPQAEKPANTVAAPAAQPQPQAEAEAVPAKPIIKAANNPQVVNRIVQKTAQRSGIEVQPESIPELIVDDSLGEGVGATYRAKANQIAVPQALYDRAQENQLTDEDYDSLVHESRHAVQTSFGQKTPSEAARTKGLIKPNRDEQSRLGYQIEGSVEGLSKSAARVARPLEADAYTFADRNTSSIQTELKREDAVTSFEDSVGVNGGLAKRFVLKARKKVIDAITKDASEAGVDLSQELETALNQIQASTQSLESLIAQTADLEILPVEQIEALQQAIEAQMKAAVQQIVQQREQFKQAAESKIAASAQPEQEIDIEAELAAMRTQIAAEQQAISSAPVAPAQPEQEIDIEAELAAMRAQIAAEQQAKPVQAEVVDSSLAIADKSQATPVKNRAKQAGEVAGQATRGAVEATQAAVAKTQEFISSEPVQAAVEKTKEAVSGAVEAIGNLINPDKAEPVAASGSSALAIAGPNKSGVVDRVKQAGEVAGKLTRGAVEGTQAVAGKIQDAVASAPVQATVEGAKQAAKAMGAVAKGGYAVAKGLESVALDLIPMGRTIKGVTQQIALPAVAFSAATAFVPGGSAVASGLTQLASGVAAPLIQGAAGSLGASAGGAVAGVLPNTFGIAGAVSGAVSSAISGATISAGEVLLQAATVVLGGKVITTAIGNTAGVALKNITESSGNNARALPQAKAAALPQAAAQPAAIEVQALAPEPIKVEAKPAVVAPKVEAPIKVEARPAVVAPEPVKATPAPIAPVKPAAAEVEVLPPEPEKSIQDYTRPQLLAALRKLGGSGDTKTSKDELTRRIESFGFRKYEPALAEIDQTIGRDGKPLAGYDTASEKALLKRIAAAEKKLNKEVEKLATATGKKRQELLASVVGGVDGLTAEINAAKRQNLSGETVKALAATQGRVRNTYQNNAAIVDARVQQSAQVQAIAQGAQAAKIRGLARVLPDGLVAEAQQPIQDTFKSLRGALRKVANFAAKQFDVAPQPTIGGTFKAIAQSEKGQAQIKDLAVNTAGFAASKLGAQFGIVPELAGDLGGALVARQAINVGTAGFSAYQSLKGDPAFQQAKRLQRLKLLAAQTNLNLLGRQRTTGEELTGDVAGFAIGNLAASAGNALGIGIPFKGAAVAMATVPKVVAARERVLDQSEQVKPKIAGLARVSDDLIAQQTYEAIANQVASISGVTIPEGRLPKLKTDPVGLQSFGTQAAYDPQSNEVSVQPRIKEILSGTAKDLEAGINEIRLIIHELRHAVQSDFGRLNFEQTALGGATNVKLTTPDDVRRDQPGEAAQIFDRSLKSSSAAISAVRPQVTPEVFAQILPTLAQNLKAVEVDAYAFEANTPQILQSVLANRQNPVSAYDRLFQGAAQLSQFSDTSRQPALKADEQKLAKLGRSTFYDRASNELVVSQKVFAALSGTGAGLTKFKDELLEVVAELRIAFQNDLGRQKTIDLERQPEAIPIALTPKSEAPEAAVEFARSEVTRLNAKSAEGLAPEQIRALLRSKIDSRSFALRNTDQLVAQAQGGSTAGLARAVELPQGLFAKIADRFKSLLPSNEKQLKRLQANYQQIFAEISNLSGVAFDPAQVPKLEINGDKLKTLGAQAFYDIEQNLILINEEIAKILGKKPKDLLKYQEQLKALTHEGRHSVQLDGGRLDIEDAAESDRLQLLGGNNLNEQQRRSVDASVEVAQRSANGRLDERQTGAIRALETDAYAFEANTGKVLQGVAQNAPKPRSVFSQVASFFRGAPKPLTPQAADAATSFALEELKDEDPSLGAVRIEGKQLRKSQRSQQRFDRAVDQSEAAQQGIRDSLGRFDDAEREINNLEQRNLDGTSARKGLEQTNETVDRFQRALKAAGVPVDKFNFSLQGLGKFALNAAAGFIGFQVLNQALPMLQRFTTESVQAAINLDKLKTALNFASGGTGKGAENLKFIRDQVDQLRIPLDAAQQGFTKLASATRGTKAEGSTTKALTTGVSSAATVLGLTGEETSGTFLALSQIASKGKVYTEELLQIQERIPGFAAIAQRALGLTGAEMSKSLEQGLISADEFLPKIAKRLQVEFGGAAQEASQNAQSAIINLQNQYQKLQESVGSAFGPAIVAGANLLSSALSLMAGQAAGLADTFQKTFGIIGAIAAPIGGLIGQLGQIPGVSQAIGASFSLVGTILTGVVVVAVSKMLAGMAALPVVSKAIAAAISLISGSITTVLKSLGTLLARFIVIQLAVETVSALFSAFVPTEAGNQFKEFADQGESALQRISAAARKAKGDVEDVLPQNADERASEGPDIGKALTFGTFSLKTDDLIKGFNNATGAKVTTIGDIKAQKTQEQADRASQVVYDLGESAANGRIGRGENSIGIVDSLRQVAGIDRQITDLSNQRSIEQSKPNADKQRIRQIDDQVRVLNGQKDAASAPVTELQGAIAQSIEKTKKALDGGIDADKTLSANDKKKLKEQATIDLKNLELAESNLKKFTDQVKSSVTAGRELAAAFLEVAATLEQARRDAERLFNQKGTSNLKQQLKDFASDPLAGVKGQVRQAEAERDKANAERDGSQKALDEQKRQLESDAAKSILAGIPIGTTGKAVDLNSSIKEIDEAKKGLDAKDKDGAKGQTLDALKQYKEGLNKQPELEKNAAAQELALKNAQQQAELAKLDRNAANRNSANKRLDNTANAGILKRQALGQIDDTQAGVESAKANIASTDRAGKAIDSQLAELEALKAKGMLSAEEYEKRQRDLIDQRSDLETRAAQAQLQLRQAVNRQILEGIELANKKANFAIQQSRSVQTIAIKNRILSGNLDDEDAQVQQNDVEQSTTAKEQAQVQAELAQVADLRARKVLSQKEATEKELELKSKLSALDEKAVDLQIQKRKQLQDIIEKNFQREAARAELAKTLSLVQIKQGRLKGVDEEDVARQSTDLEIRASEGQTALLNRRLAEARQQRSRGELSPKEFADKEREIQQQLANEKLKLVDLEIQKQQQLRAAIDKTFDRQKAQLDLLQQQQGNAIQGGFVDKYTSGQPINLKLEETQTEGANLRVQQSTLAQKRALLETQLSDERTYAGLGAKERADRARELQKELAGIDGEVIANRKALEDNARAQFNTIADQRVAAANRIIEREQKLTEIYSRSLETSRKLVDARGQLAQAINQGRQIQAQSGIDGISRAIDIKRKAETEQDPDKAYQYQKVADRLGVGNATEDSLLQKKFDLEDKLAQLKQQALLSEFELKKALLEIDLKRDRLSAEQALRESKRAQITAKGELDKAIRSGDTEAIAEARQKLDLANEDVTANQQALASQDELASYARANLDAARRNAQAQFDAEQQGKSVTRAGEVIEAGGSNNLLSRVMQGLQPLGRDADGRLTGFTPANNIAPISPISLPPAIAPLSPTTLQPTESPALSNYSSDLATMLAQKLDALNANIERLANTPRSLQFQTKDPVGDYSKWMNDQAGAIMGGA